MIKYVGNNMQKSNQYVHEIIESCALENLKLRFMKQIILKNHTYLTKYQKADTDNFWNKLQFWYLGFVQVNIFRPYGYKLQDKHHHNI